MKNIILIGSLACILCAMPYACREGMKRQEYEDCRKASRICTEYWNVHGGECAECSEMKRCKSDGILE